MPVLSAVEGAANRQGGWTAMGGRRGSWNRHAELPGVAASLTGESIKRDPSRGKRTAPRKRPPGAKAASRAPPTSAPVAMTIRAAQTVKTCASSRAAWTCRVIPSGPPSAAIRGAAAGR